MSFQALFRLICDFSEIPSKDYLGYYVSLFISILLLLVYLVLLPSFSFSLKSLYLDSSKVILSESKAILSK